MESSRIRKAVLEDADAVYVLMQELGSAQFDRETMREILKEQLERPEIYVCFVNEESHRLKACFTLG